MNHYLKEFGPGDLTDHRYARFFFACCSLLAYRSHPVSEKYYHQAGFDQVHLISKDGAQCYVLINPEIIVIAFRGTEVKERSDVWADIKIWKTKRGKGGRGLVQKKGLVHSGFKDELDKLWPVVLDYMRENTDKKLYITGHSLGGAMATIAAGRALHVNADHNARYAAPLEEIYTYGAPRAGNKEFVKTLKFPHHRLQNNNDVVCRIPSVLLGYRHQCDSVYLNHSGYVKTFGSWQRFCDMLKGRWRAILKGQLFDGVYDHSMDKYCKKLYNIWKDEFYFLHTADLDSPMLARRAEAEKEEKRAYKKVQYYKKAKK